MDCALFWSLQKQYHEAEASALRATAAAAITINDDEDGMLRDTIAKYVYYSLMPIVSAIN